MHKADCCPWFGNTHMTSHPVPLFSPPFRLTALLSLSGQQPTYQPRQQWLNCHSIFSPPFFFTARPPSLQSLIHTPNQSANISPFYLRATLSLSLSPPSLQSLLQDSQTNHHLPSQQSTLSLPPSLSNSDSEMTLFRTPASETTFNKPSLPNLPTKQWHSTPDSSDLYKRGDIPKLWIIPSSLQKENISRIASSGTSRRNSQTEHFKRGISAWYAKE